MEKALKNQQNPSLIKPSGQTFSFDSGLATGYGFNCAFVIHHLQFWIRYNKERGINLINGRTWTYQTYDLIAAHIKFLTARQVRTAIDKLVEKGVLIKENYNKKIRENTLWFAFSDESIYVDDLIPKPKPKTYPKKETKTYPKKPSKNTYPSDNQPLKTSNELPKSPICHQSQGADGNVRYIDKDTKRNRDNTTSLPPPKKPPDIPKPKAAQRPRVVASLEKEKQNIYPSLQNIDQLSTRDKQRLTQAFSEETVSKAVDFSKRKKPRTLDGFLFYFCKNPDFITQSIEEQTIEKNKQTAFESKKIKDLIIQACEESKDEAVKKNIVFYPGEDIFSITTPQGKSAIPYCEVISREHISYIFENFGLKISKPVKL